MTRDIYKFSDGHECHSMLDALIYLKARAGITVTDVNGVDVTARFRGILTDHPYGSGR